VSKAKQPDMAQLLKELDDILAWFESGEADVETAVKKYEAGLSKLDQLEKQLKSAQLKVKKLDQKFDA